ncbi:hypothetical protein CMV_024739 [Castanea mollissima]|uniref:Uncharacterized protein n=1 Tax=Castanea mollissima TaxID=60419 RepID=A0A8J4VHL5_9ROSI|nr:hypothetical protein CMV_024739 [Castanea mollissima]
MPCFFFTQVTLKSNNIIDASIVYQNREGSLLNGAPEERTPNASDYIQGSVTDGDVSVALIDELDEERCADECNGSLSIRSPLTRSSTVGVPPLSLQPKPNIITDKSISGAHGTVDGDIYRTLYNQLQQVMAEAESAKREAFQATLKCRKAERDANEAIRKFKESESLYAEDLKCKKEMEKVLAKQREELEKVKHERDQVMRELQISQNQRSLFESQVKESVLDQSVKGLEMRIMSVLELSQIYKRERDEMQMERDTALKEVEELRRKQGVVASCACMPQFFSEFTFSEIKEATRNFDPSLIIGQGGYGNIFKCFLRCTQVAIKVLLPGSSQGPSEFHQEVCEILEDNALLSKRENGECEPWVVASRLRDHLLLPRERKNPVLWKKVEELVQEDSRVDRYPKLVKGESKVVWEWQVEGSLSTSKVRKKVEANRLKSTEGIGINSDQLHRTLKAEPKALIF